MNEIEIDEVALIELIKDNLRGAGIITIRTETEVTNLTAEGKAALGQVEKVSRINCQLKVDYEAAVNRQRVREGLAPNFEAAEERSNGMEPLHGWPFSCKYVKSRGGEPCLYFDVVVLKSLEHTYRDQDGNEIPKERVEPFLRKNKNNQGTKKPVVFRSYNVQHIRGIKIGGIEVSA